MNLTLAQASTPRRTRPAAFVAGLSLTAAALMMAAPVASPAASTAASSTAAPSTASALEGTYQSSASVKAPLTKQCRARLKRPKAPVASATLATCVMAAQKSAKTAVIKTAYDDGQVGKGPYRFGRTTDASVRMNDGTSIVALGQQFWVKQTGGSWTRGSKKGSAQAQLALVTGALWRSYATPQSYRRTLASSKAWVPTGGVKRINGVKARAYDGDPQLPNVTTDAYRIWLDDKYRPVRIVATTTAFGFSTTMTQDFTRWGKKVRIVAPS